MNIAVHSFEVPSQETHNPLTAFFAHMEQCEQEIREAARAVEYCTVFDHTNRSEGQYTAAIQALGSLMETIGTFQQCFLDPWVPLLAFDARGGAQGAWTIVLEIIDQTIVTLASCSPPACFSAVRSQTEYDQQSQIDIYDQYKELQTAIADAFRTGARWRDRVRFESLRFVRLHDTARFQRTLKRRRRWS